MRFLSSRLNNDRPGQNTRLCLYFLGEVLSGGIGGSDTQRQLGAVVDVTTSLPDPPQRRWRQNVTNCTAWCRIWEHNLSKAVKIWNFGTHKNYYCYIDSVFIQFREKEDRSKCKRNQNLKESHHQSAALFPYHIPHHGLSPTSAWVKCTFRICIYCQSLLKNLRACQNLPN